MVSKNTFLSEDTAWSQGHAELTRFTAGRTYDQLYSVRGGLLSLLFSLGALRLSFLQRQQCSSQAHKCTGPIHPCAGQ